jgi:dephospho-CoA kinase
VKQRIEALRRQRVGVVVLEAALLIEANWTDLVDQVWVTVAPEADVIDRLSRQKGFTEEQARARINSQMPVAERSKCADVVIENDSDLDTLRASVEGLWQKIRFSEND